MIEFNFLPENIFNKGETETFVVSERQPTVSLKEKKQVEIVTSEERGTVTAAICCNAARNFLPPLTIYP